MFAINIDIDAFILSNSLDQHPVRNESIDYKSKYLAVLEYFVSKYSSKNEISKAMFLNYRNAFKGNEKFMADETTVKLYAKKVNRNKFDFKDFKLFTYRYCLLCDVFMLNAFNNKKLARTIIDDIKLIFNKRYHQKMERLFSLLFDSRGNSKEFDFAKYHIECWQKNMSFLAKPKKRVLITANMSAGKSTLINALIGKHVNRTMNDACTAKIHYIYDQAFEDNYTHEWDYELNLNADRKALLEDDERNSETEILVATYFHMFGDRESRLCIIDTPGVNSAASKEHGELTKQTLLTDTYDLLVYVVNAENSGTDDDRKYLSYISEHIPKEKIVFVLNKLDRFRQPEDSIFDSIENLRNDLLSHGFNNPVICPISSYTGELVKKMAAGITLNDDEADEYTLLSKKFNRPEFDLSKFYDVSPISDAMIQKVKGADLFVKSGFYGFEQILLQRR